MHRRWPTYNWLARTLMGLFLIICHFLVVYVPYCSFSSAANT